VDPGVHLVIAVVLGLVDPIQRERVRGAAPALVQGGDESLAGADLVELVLVHAPDGTKRSGRPAWARARIVGPMVFRRRRPVDALAEVDPQAVPRAYRAPIDDALQARRQFIDLVAAVRPGPLRERLGELGARVDAGVLAVWGTAQHGAQLERVLSTLDPDRVTGDYKRAKRDGAGPEVLEPLAARFASVQRLLNALEDVRAKLPVLEARLGTAVARTAELTLVSPAAAAPTELDALGHELDALTVELQALGAATHDVG
jgi:hypothetical protein